MRRQVTAVSGYPSHAACRRAALEALARTFPEDPQTGPLLRARALEDPDAACRRAALLALSRTLNMPHASILASRDFDGLYPGRDPREPITADLLAVAAKKLGKAENDIRDLYRQLAEKVPLTFTWPE